MVSKQVALFSRAAQQARNPSQLQQDIWGIVTHAITGDGQTIPIARAKVAPKSL